MHADSRGNGMALGGGAAACKWSTKYRNSAHTYILTQMQTYTHSKHQAALIQSPLSAVLVN